MIVCQRSCDDCGKVLQVQEFNSRGQYLRALLEQKQAQCASEIEKIELELARYKKKKTAK